MSSLPRRSNHEPEVAFSLAGARLRGRPPVVVAEAILQDLESRSHLAPKSFESIAADIRRFATFCELVLERETFAAVRPQDAARFVEARTKEGATPAISTRYRRRAAIRLLFTFGRELGALESDPTLDLHLGPKSALAARPLEEEEVVLCRQWAHEYRGEGQRGAIWALAEAGGHPADIADLQIEALDLDLGTVKFAANGRHRERIASLTPWGAEQIRGYLERTGSRGAGALFASSHTSSRARASRVDMALISILDDAGLRDGDVKPRSIVAWAARRIYLESGIEEVARRFGMRSLDSAARLIDLEWSEPR